LGLKQITWLSRNLSMRAGLLGLGCCLLALGASGASGADRAHTLNVYAWSDYFPQSLTNQFQSETGIHINYSVLDSPETAETKLSVGHSDFDIVTMNAAPELGREIPKGFWKALDPASIPNARNADPEILKRLQAVDPGNKYAVPWMWGTVGIIYNAAKIEATMPNAPINSLDMVFKRSVASKFASCGISILDSWGDILPMVARYLGQGLLSAEPAKLDAVMAKLHEIKPYIRRIASSGYYEQLADGEMCLAIGYSGDAMIARRMAKEGNTKVDVEYAFAREIVPLYIDSLVIPADSPNAAGAHAFINFVMRPEISAAVTQFIGFASGNAAALPLLPAAVRGNQAVYPPAEVRQQFELARVYSADEIRSFSRAWLRFKSEN
jgi:putrescine transport system substrate-binding protein